MTRRIVTKRGLRQARQSGHGWFDILVRRYARGAGGVTPFRSACDRDYEEIVTCADTIWLKILVLDHRRDSDSMKGTLRGAQGPG